MPIGNMLIVSFQIDFSFPAYHRYQASIITLPISTHRTILWLLVILFRKFDNELYLSWYILINNSANTIDHVIYAHINKKEWVGLVRILLWTAKGFNQFLLSPVSNWIREQVPSCVKTNKIVVVNNSIFIPFFIIFWGGGQ